MQRAHAEGLLYQALETELGGEQVYEAALRAAQNDDLREEWQKYLDQTRTHQERLRGAFTKLGLDPDEERPARLIVRHKGESLVAAIQAAIETLTPQEAELVAGECVVDAETKDHLNWSLLSHIVEEGPKPFAQALREPVEATMEEENKHRFHNEGWTRELWMAHLGFKAALPPPEEEKNVTTKIGAGRAEHARSQYT